MSKRVLSRALFALFLLLGPVSCMSAYKKSVGGDTNQVFHQVFLTDFNTAWQSVLDALRSSPLDQSSRESGFIQTKWTDNTSQKNFVDSLGAGVLYLKAQYRFQVTVAKGFYNGEPSVKVTIEKEQLVQSDVLEGWRSLQTDALDENTLLYRIGRLIFIRTKLAKIEEEKTRQAVENVRF